MMERKKITHQTLDDYNNIEGKRQSNQHTITNQTKNQKKKQLKIAQNNNLFFFSLTHFP